MHTFGKPLARSNASFFLGIVTASLMLSCATSARADENLRDAAIKSLRRASQYYLEKVSTEGGYLYQYSADLSRREGEHKATASMVWVQPPGTPAVGLAYLEAYQATKDAYYLEASKKAADCLIRGQLRSGGWGYNIEFDVAKRAKFAYRVPPAGEQGENTTVLDDNNTQAAIRFLIRLDVTLAFKESTIHEAVRYALDHLVQAQYPNGAWPQRYNEFPEAKDFPVVKAGYPDTWSREFPKAKYSQFYTFNDNAIGDVVEVLLDAAKTYNEPRYKASAEQGGDFALLAQMPEPQPIWAQQYDPQMHPSWARKFEPPSVTGGESQSILQMLLLLYRETGQERFLAPIPKALAFLRKHQLPDGRLARFYELWTSKPLYFTRDYVLTYSDADMPTHYGFKVGSKLDAIEREFERLKKTPWAELNKPRKKGAAGPPSAQLVEKTKAAIASLDDQGRWLQKGRLKTYGDTGADEQIVSTGTFNENVRTLSRYIAETRPDEKK
jgi:hypothetical protein